MADRHSKGGLGRLFAQAQQRRRERKQAKEGFHYRETGGGYGGYGGTADRGAYRPDRGQFGAGYTDYGPHGHEARRPWEGGARPSAGETYRAGPDRPHGLGAAYDEDRIPAMERGWHPERPGAGTVEPIGAGMGGYGGASHLPGERFRAGMGGYGGGERAPGPRGSRQRGGGWEARAMNAEQIGPGAFRREHAAYSGEHRGRNWEGGSDAARTAAWFGGGSDDLRTWERSGPSSERTSDWYGGDVGRSSGETWYGGGLHEAREDTPARDFGNLGGPDMGRYGREAGGDRGGGRGFGGPLGRPGERARGEQGRLFGSTYQGVDDVQPIGGEAIAGRGHVGGRHYRDLAHFGRGEGDPGSHDRFHARHEEGEHFRER